jgi:hypothetical protein
MQKNIIKSNVRLKMTEKQENISNEINLFISALPECKDEIKIILNELENYKNKKSYDHINVAGNSYVKSLIDKNSSLNENKSRTDEIKDIEDNLGFIGLIANKTIDSNYPNINIERDYHDLFEYTETMDYLILAKEGNENSNDNIEKFKEKLDEMFCIDKYNNIKEFKTIVSEEIEEILNISEDPEDLEYLIQRIINIEGSDNSEIDEQELLKSILKEGMNMNDDEVFKETKYGNEEFLKLFGDDDIDEKNEEFDLIDDELIELLDAIDDNYSITKYTLNNNNIIMDFEEYILLNFVEIAKFMKYESKNSDRELYDSAKSLSDGLENLLKLFDERIINTSEFNKIREKDKYFVKSCVNNEITIENIDNMSQIIKEIHSTFQTLTIYMRGLNKIAKEYDVDGDEYDKVLSKLVKNLESTVNNLESIEENIKFVQEV